MSRPVSNKDCVYVFKRRKPNGVLYVIRRTQRYNPETKRMDTISEVLVGKILPDNPDKIVSTRPKKKSHKQLVLENSDVSNSSEHSDSDNTILANRQHIGACQLLDHVAKLCGIEEDIYELTDEGTAQKLISCARFLVCTGGQRLSQIATWQIMHPIPYADGLSKDICHRLTESLGIDETFRQSLFQRRFMRQPDGTLIIAFDGSTVSTYSKNQNEARYGYSKTKDGLPTIKWLALYASESCEPLAFTKQPGNVPDVVSVTNALSQLSVLTTKDIVLVADNGFYSDSNAYDMIIRDFGFLMRIEIGTNWINTLFQKHLAELESSSCCCSDDGYVTGITISTIHTFCKVDSDGIAHYKRRKCYLHFFLDSRKRSSQNADINVKLNELMNQLNSGIPVQTLKKGSQKLADEYLICTEDDKGQVKYSMNDEAIQTLKKRNGIFAVVGYGPFEVVKDTQKAFTTYINREHIEDHFRAEKQTVDGDTVRSWYGDNYMGRMIIQFVALCYEDCLWACIRSIKKTLRDEINHSKTEGKNKVITEKRQRLLTWLNSTCLQDILSWFDAIEVFEVSSQIKNKRWNTETLERDRMFLEYLGIQV